jgi:hypothetical protein
MADHENQHAPANTAGSGPPEPATSATNDGHLDKLCSVSYGPLNANEHGHVGNLRAHPTVVAALRDYTVVNVVRVSITCHQSGVPNPKAGTSWNPYHIRFGLAPRELPTHTTGTSVVEFIPSLVDMFTQPFCAEKSTVVWGSGPDAVPFPRGLQLDLAATENRSKYVTVLMANSSRSLLATDAIAYAQVNFVIRCSMPGYGAPY